MRRGGVRVPGSALTADVRVGRQAVAEQLHVPSGGIHVSLGAQLPCQPARSARSDPSPSLEPTLPTRFFLGAAPLPGRTVPARFHPGESGFLTSLHTWALAGGVLPPGADAPTT